MDLEACYWLESEACACAHILRYVGKVLRQAWVPHSLPLPYPSSCPSELPKGQAFFVPFQDLLQEKAQAPRFGIQGPLSLSSPGNAQWRQRTQESPHRPRPPCSVPAQTAVSQASLPFLLLSGSWSPGPNTSATQTSGCSEERPRLSLLDSLQNPPGVSCPSPLSCSSHLRLGQEGVGAGEPSPASPCFGDWGVGRGRGVRCPHVHVRAYIHVCVHMP